MGYTIPREIVWRARRDHFVSRNTPKKNRQVSDKVPIGMSNRQKPFQAREDTQKGDNNTKIKSKSTTREAKQHVGGVAHIGARFFGFG